MTDKKSFPGENPEMPADDESRSRPLIRPRTTMHVVPPAETPLERELRRSLPDDLPPPPRGETPYRRTAGMRPPPGDPLQQPRGESPYGRTAGMRPPPLENPLERELRRPPVGDPLQQPRGEAPYDHRPAGVRPPPPERPGRPAQPAAPEVSRSGTGKWLLVGLGVIVAAGCAAFGTWYVMTGTSGPAPAPATAPVAVKSPDAKPQANAPAQPALPEPIKNTFWQQAQNAGAKTCARAASELGNIVTMGSNYLLQSSTHKDAPDRHAFQMLTGQTYDQQDFKAQAATILFAAPIDGQCEANAVRVVPVRQSCAQMGQGRAMQGAVKSQDMSGVALYEFPGNANRIMLIPAPNDTCVAVSVVRSGG